MTILPIAYMPSVRYFARILAGDCIIDTGEHFIKRSERNRTAILSPAGRASFTVRVEHADRPRTPVHDVRIDYSGNWQHQHWTALVSYYRSSPYFDHYAPHLEPFYRRRFDHLADFDLELTRTLLHFIGLELPPVSHDYVQAADGDLDLRPKRAVDGAFRQVEYFQVFSDRMPFVGELSFADMLFCEGPGAKALLAESLRL